MAPDLETIGLGAALRAGDTADPAAIGAAMLAAGPWLLGTALVAVALLWRREVP
jgi:hypothetical protein